MNLIELLVIGILLLSAFKAYRKGFVKSMFGLVSFGLTIFLALQLYPVGSRLIVEHTKIDNMIQDKVAKSLDLEIENEVNKVGNIENEKEFIDNLPLTEKMKKELKVNNNEEIYNLFGVNSLIEYVSSYISRIIINAISLLLVFIVVFFILRLGLKALDILSNLPVVNMFNNGLGLALGLILGVLRVWMVFAIFAVMSSLPFMIEIIQSINNTVVAKFLYNNNLIVDSLFKIGSGI